MRIKSFEEYQIAYKESLENNENFWKNYANTFTWKKPFSIVNSGNFQELNFKWFEDGKLNITENCLDRHIQNKAQKPALVFEPNDPSSKVITYNYQELLTAVNKTANMLTQLGVTKGDRVCLYMGMVPELLISVLACARIGAIHSVVFGGFSAKSLADRIEDAKCKLLITNDGSYRGEKIIHLKEIADEALKVSPSIENVIVHQRIGGTTKMLDGRDHWWHELYQDQAEDFDPVVMNAEDPLFILYTSGSTGKPKGIQHSTAGYMVWASYTFENVFQVDENDRYWCTADIGWITGHSYITYGPLLNGATTYMFEGVPTWPDAGRFWEIVDKHKITHFYTAPTAIRALMACDSKLVENKDLSSLKVLGTVGEPINIEAWNWYDEKIGKGKCPIVDTWWQTETGGIMISPLAGITKTIPTFATLPLPGVKPELVDEKGKIIEGNDVSGNLCISQSWPGQARTIYGDHERFRQTYFSTYPGKYFTGDGAKRDQNGNYRITGRVDDVMNVSGHRLGTAEVEDAIDLLNEVVETAVVGYPHDIKGQGIYAYVVTHNEVRDAEAMQNQIRKKVNEIIGPIAKPDKIQFVKGLPKTRSGKIMRRILRKVAEGRPEELGDTSTLLDPSVVEDIVKGAKNN